MAVAESPLTGEQLNVALTVQPGNNIWNETKLPRSTKQVVARCGGGLLEIDEEDNCVRFIHHSVVSHMGGLKVGMDGRRLARSWISDAEAFMGSVCVTYLNFRELDRRVVLRRNVDPISVSEALKKEASSYNPILASVIRHIKGDKHRTVAAKQLNIFPILLELKDQKSDEGIMTCFLPYASKYWTQHTAHLTEEDETKIDILWRELVNNRPPHILIPWSQSLDQLADQGGMLEYAISHSHAYLYRLIMRSFPGVNTFLWTGHWALKKASKRENRALWLTEMINRCLVAGSSFVHAAYWFALLLNDVEEEDLKAMKMTPEDSKKYHYALFMGRDFVEITAENATDRLWASVETACSFIPKALDRGDNPRSVCKAIAGALRVLAMRLSLQESTAKENSNSARAAFWRSLEALSRDGDEDTFHTFWNYRLSVVNWGGDAQYLESAMPILRNASKHNNFKLVSKVVASMKSGVELSILEQIVEEVKQQAQSIIRPKLLLGPLMESASYVKDQKPIEGPWLAEVMNYMMNKEYDKVLETIHHIIPSNDGVTNSNLIILNNVVQQERVLRWVITNRYDKVFRKLPFLRQAILYWPTVLLYAITTYAHADAPHDEDAESESIIFFGLLEEMKLIDSKDYCTIGSEDGLDVDPGWTALHAATLWQPFAVKALLETWPDMVNRKTRLGLTPLVIALCGRLRAKDAFATVEALLNAGAYQDTGALWAYPYLSPLDISIAYRPHSVSRLLCLVGFSAMRAAVLEGAQDPTLHTLMKIISFIESRISFQGDYEEWTRRIQGVTSLEEQYLLGFYRPRPDKSLPQAHIYELGGCVMLHTEDRVCNCNDHF